MVGSCECTTPLILTVWMLEKSAKIPVPAVLVVWGIFIIKSNTKRQIKEAFREKKFDAWYNFTPPPTFTNQECATTSICFVEGEGEPDNRWGDGFIQGSFTLWLVKYVVEDEQRFIIASIHNRTDLDSQPNRGCATFNWDVSVFYKRGRGRSVNFLWKCHKIFCNLQINFKSRYTDKNSNCKFPALLVGKWN